jgi:hypothetical protein
MTEAAVRGVIAEDFRPDPAIRAGKNPVQGTSTLSIAVPNLVPASGTAIVTYLFGYHSHRLIEVNIVWSKATDRGLTPEQLAATGATLQAYFLGEHFPRGHVTAGRLRNGLLLFRATDMAGHEVALMLSGPITKDKKTGKDALTPTALSLAYAADPAHPDIFRLKRGSF